MTVKCNDKHNESISDQYLLRSFRTVMREAEIRADQRRLSDFTYRRLNRLVTMPSKNNYLSSKKFRYMRKVEMMHLVRISEVVDSLRIEKVDRTRLERSRVMFLLGFT